MKKNFIILFVLLTTSLFSQIKISGVITDTLNAPAPFVPIGLVSLPDSSIVKGSMTDDAGKYTMEFSKFGNYLLKINAIGYQEKISNEIHIDSLSDKNIQVNIKLSASLNTLNEVSISAMRRVIEFKDGNTIVNVENSPLAKGNTLFDLLSKLPGVSIVDNVIQLNGKSGVIIMLDGRVQQVSNTQLINLLKSINAEVVEKIELMKNPPVKYDASGTSGMINIKTKKTKLVGYNGAVYTSFSQGFYARSMSGIALNYKAEKFAVFTNLNHNRGLYQSKFRNVSKYTNDSSVTEFDAVNSLKDVDNGINYKVGGDWYVNKNNTIGFKIEGGPASYNSKGTGTNTIYMDNYLGYDHLDVRTSTPDKWNINNYNLNAEHHFDTTGVLNFASDYTKLTEAVSSNIENFFLDKNNNGVLPSNIFRSNSDNNVAIFASKLDFTKTLKHETSFELGAKASFVDSKNDYLFERKNNSSEDYFKDTALTNNYTYREQTYAAYFNFIKSYKKINFHLGVRAEYTMLEGNNTSKGFGITKNYLQLFPNISFEYTPSENHSVQLNFNRRIDRPPYAFLMPFQFYQDQYNYFEGNPFLFPHYSNTVELTHSFKQSITNTFTYTRIDKVWLYYTKQDDNTKVTTNSFKNMKYNNYYAYSFFIQRTLKPWWEVSANALAAYIEYAGDIEGEAFKTAAFYYAPSLTNTLTVRQNTKIEVIAFYNSPKNDGFLQMKSRWMLSFAIKKTFFKDKLDCSIGIDDLFYSNVLRSGVDFNNQNWNFRATSDSRRLVVSINYNFGKIKTTERDTYSNEQEKQRLNH